MSAPSTAQAEAKAKKVEYAEKWKRRGAIDLSKITKTVPKGYVDCIIRKSDNLKLESSLDVVFFFIVTIKYKLVCFPVSQGVIQDN